MATDNNDFNRKLDRALDTTRLGAISHHDYDGSLSQGQKDQISDSIRRQKNNFDFTPNQDNGGSDKHYSDGSIQVIGYFVFAGKLLGMAILLSFFTPFLSVIFSYLLSSIIFVLICVAVIYLTYRHHFIKMKAKAKPAMQIKTVLPPNEEVQSPLKQSKPTNFVYEYKRSE